MAADSQAVTEDAGGAALGQSDEAVLGAYPADVVALVSAYDWNTGVVLRIIRRESNFDCAAYNGQDWYPGSGNHASGLMQILIPLHADLFLPGEDPFNCADNLAAAYRLYAYDGSDFRDWAPVPW